MFRAFLVSAVCAGGLAVAAPVPKTTPPPGPKTPANFILGTAVVDVSAGGAGKLLKFSYPRTAAVSPLRPQPGVLAKPLTTSLQLTSVKVTTIAGKELTGEELDKALASAVPAVRCTSAFDPEWRKLFDEDVLFIEPVRAVGGANPVAPVGGAIAPLPIRPIIRRALPVIPIEEPPVEKKEEKKEEKK